MRDINRIDKFLEDFGKIWKTSPDLRFGQLVNNIQNFAQNDMFYVEEDDYLKWMKNCLGVKDEG